MSEPNDLPVVPPIHLTDEQIEAIVARVTARVIQNFYIEIGKSVTKKFFWLVGLAFVSLAIWAASNGKFKFN